MKTCDICGRIVFLTLARLVVVSIALPLIFGLIPSVSAAPYNGQEFTYHQPDGTEFKIRLYGDEFYAVEETLDGYVVVRETNTWFFHYAELSEDGKEVVPAGKGKKQEDRVGKADPLKLGLKKHIRIAPEARKEKVRKRQQEMRVGEDGRPVDVGRPKDQDNGKDKPDEKK